MKHAQINCRKYCKLYFMPTLKAKRKGMRYDRNASRLAPACPDIRGLQEACECFEDSQSSTRTATKEQQIESSYDVCVLILRED